MEYLYQFPVEYDRLLNGLSSVVGIVGFVFGTWRYLKERNTQKQLSDRERQLNDALSRLERLQKFASGINRYPSAL